MDKEEIINDLTRRITSEDLPQGCWLVEREISERYGISRTPVREILRTLSANGLVEQLPGKGFRVKELNLEDIIAIFNAREAVETVLTRLACKFGGEQFLAEVRQMHDKLVGVDVSKNIVKAMGIGRNLHDCIADGANNYILSEFYFKLKNLHALTASLTRRLPKVEENSKDYHLLISEAILEKDIAKSEQLMREHLRLTCKLTVEGYINDRTGYDDDVTPPASS